MAVLSFDSLQEIDMMRPTFRPTSSRVPLTLAVAFAVTLTACGGDADPTTTTVDETAPGAVVEEVALDPVVIDTPATDAVDTDVVEIEAPEPAVTDGVMASGDGGWQSLQDDWTSSVASVQARFGELGEEELIATGGDRDAFVMLVQEKYNLEPDDAEQQVSDFEASL